MSLSNELIDTTVAELPVSTPSSNDALVELKYKFTQQLLEQYVALEKLRESQLVLLFQQIRALQSKSYRLTGMLTASVIVNLYLVYRFF